MGKLEFCFIHVSFEMLVKLWSEDVKDVVGYVNLNLGREVKAGDIGIKFTMVWVAVHKMSTWSNDDGLY